MAPKPNPVPRLVIIEGEEKGKIIKLTDGTLVVGRSKGDVLIQDPRISRSHLALHYDAKSGQITFTDLKSLNGTLVNGVAKETGELRDGDQLQLGNTTLDFQVSGAEERGSKIKEKIQKARKEESADPPKPSIQIEPELRPVSEEDSSAPKDLSKDVPTRLKDLPTTTLSGLRLTWKKVPPLIRASGIAVSVFVTFFLWSLAKPNPEQERKAFVEITAKAQELYNAGKREEALELAVLFAEKHQNLAVAHLLSGRLYFLLQKNEAAIGALQRAQELDPDNVVAATLLIRVLLKSGLAQEAQAALKPLDAKIEAGQGNKDLFIDLGQLLLEFRDRLKLSSEKTMILAKALENEFAPQSSLGHRLEFVLHYSEARKLEAMRALERALQFDPKDPSLLENLALLRLELKDNEGAIAAVNTWMERIPASQRPLLIMSQIKMHVGDNDGAVPLLEQILKDGVATPEAPEANYMLGQIAFQKRNVKEALNFYHTACTSGLKVACEQEVATQKAIDTPVQDPLEITPRKKK